MAGADPDEPAPADEPEPSQRWWRTGEWPLQRWRTGEWPSMRIDLSEAYANVRSRAKHLRRRRIISGVVAAVVFAGLFTVVGFYYVSSIPLPDAMALPATTTVYYADGTTVLARLGSQRRTIIDVDSLPDYVGQAVVAAEDPQFWLDSSSLISRQYARAATGTDAGSATGQARLAVMSWKLEDTYNKAQILGFYLNTVYFGRGSYGIQAAAQSYFGTDAATLTRAQAIVLAGVIASPGDGRYDPTVDPIQARSRFVGIAQRLVSSHELTQAQASALTEPAVTPYDPSLFASDLDKPTGLVVAQVLAEVRATGAFRDAADGDLEDGGYSIVTTIDPKVQRALVAVADPTQPGSLMAGQPNNLQAAAVVVEPGTGRVLGYYGGDDGTGVDYADGQFGAHPPGQTMDVYAVAAALSGGISVASRWDSPPTKDFPDRDTPVQDVYGAPCQPTCTLAEATQASLSVPLYAVTATVGPAAVVDAASAVGIRSLWVPATDDDPAREVALTAGAGASVTPEPFGTDVALGPYPVTVLDQANAMATLAAGGVRASVHFLLRVTGGTSPTATSGSSRGITIVEPAAAPTRVLDADVVADLDATLAGNQVGALAPDWPSASQGGSAPLRDSPVETAHAWHIGYTPDLAVAVWVGNRDDELPLKDKLGARVTGVGLPADIYRTVLVAASQALGLPRSAFPAPANIGDPTLGDAAAGDATVGDASTGGQ